MASNDVPVQIEDEMKSDSKIESHQPKKKNRHRPHRKKNKSKSEDDNPSEIPKSPKSIKNDKSELKNHKKPDKKLRIIKNSDNSKTPTKGEQGKPRSRQNSERKHSGGGGPRNRRDSEKFKFPDYFLPEVVEIALHGGSLVSGILRIHPKNYEEAYISSPDGKSDICIQGMKNRNRALHGDKVAVNLNPESEWMIMSGQLRDFQLLENVTKTVDLDSSAVAQKCNVEEIENSDDKSNSDENSKLCDDEDVKKSQDLVDNVEALKIEDNSDIDVVIEEISEVPKEKTKKTRRSPRKKSKKSNEAAAEVIKNPGQIRSNISRQKSNSHTELSIEDLKRNYPDLWQQFVRKTGKVVSILEKKNSRCTVGYLKLFQDKNPNFALFSPIDNRFPRLKIAKNHCPPDFFTRPQDFEEYLFLAKLIQWDQISYGLGTLEQKLGSDKDIDARTKGILLENSIDYEDFPQKIEENLPDLPFKIPENEIQKRRDFRQNCVFTIDPLTARDLDDALSIEKLKDNTYKVAVHIADVSYFVKDKTALDKEAENRATSVYLVQKVIPMLPRTLCEHLCSLNPGEDRLTFSVEWILSPEGEILDTWFGKSVIKSAVKLAYEHAQDMLDEPNKDWTAEELPEIHAPWTAKIISEKVNFLQSLALKLRAKRVENGALRLDQPKLCFSLDKESGLPQGYRVYEQRHSNRLIEEFMLLANISVAQKIQSAFPDIAVLRCHPRPREVLMDKAADLLQRFGISIDTSNSLALQNTINAYKPAPEDLEALGRWQVLMSVLAKPMHNAEYFCTGMKDDVDKYHHYALSVPMYTHFTSPIRRYPDILVHRLLDAALKPKELKWNPQQIEMVAQHCNDRKLAAKTCSEKSAELFLCLFIRQSGPVNVEAVVVQVMDHSMDCILSNMGVVKRVYFNRNEEIEGFDYQKNEGNNLAMFVKWKHTSTPQVLQMFTTVQLSLEAHEKSAFDYNARLIKP